MSPLFKAKTDRTAVSLVRVRDHSMRQSSVDKAVKEAVDLLGGFKNFVKEGQIVAIKPNQTLWKLATDGSTTSPRMVISLIKLCKEAGARDVWVIEAAGHAQSTRMVMNVTGMADAVKEAGAKVIYLEEMAEKVEDFGSDSAVRFMPVADILDQVDVFINCPKAKTHFVDPISGACKNWVGLMPMSTRLLLQRDVDPYYQGTAELLKRYKPNLNIFDGMIAGEGQGPGGNKPFWWGFIMASSDPVAADVTLARLFSLDWENIRMAREAEKLGVGVYDPDKIDIKGVRFEDAVVRVTPADPSVNRYPVRVLVGSGPDAAIEGTLGHWKTIADAWLESKVWDIFTVKGTPTFMFGDIDDPMFEQHIQEGPYVVLGDSAKDKYKYDPRVVFIPGSPVPQSYMQHEMVEGMGYGSLYEPGLRVYQMATAARGRLTGAAGKQVQKGSVLKGVAAAAAVAVPVIAYLASRGAEEMVEEEEVVDETMHIADSEVGHVPE